jgi:hypothetical protein
MSYFYHKSRGHGVSAPSRGMRCNEARRKRSNELSAGSTLRSSTSTSFVACYEPRPLDPYKATSDPAYNPSHSLYHPHSHSLNRCIHPSNPLPNERRSEQSSTRCMFVFHTLFAFASWRLPQFLLPDNQSFKLKPTIPTPSLDPDRLCSRNSSLS